MTHPFESRPHGFTLLELLIVLALTGLVAGAGYTFYTTQFSASIQQERVADMQQNLRSAMEIMARDIRMAGYDPTGLAGAGITTATASTLSFTCATDGDANGVDDDSDGTVDEADEGTLTSSITYSLGDGNGDGNPDILRSVNGGANVVVAEHMEALEFNYLLQNGTSSGAPTALDEITAVRVALLARTRQVDRDFTDSATYTGTLAKWGPFKDGRRRRLLQRTIQCRNQGFQP